LFSLETRISPDDFVFTESSIYYGPTSKIMDYRLTERFSSGFEQNPWVQVDMKEVRYVNEMNFKVLGIHFKDYHVYISNKVTTGT
jgi:hypothetical protein